MSSHGIAVVARRNRRVLLCHKLLVLCVLFPTLISSLPSRFIQHPPPRQRQTHVFVISFISSRVWSSLLFPCQVPPPPPPDALTDRILDVSLNVGYQRLRKALLWNDSKLQAALFDLLVSSVETN